MTSHHKVGSLKQLKFILSAFVSPEVQNQGISWATFLPRTVVRNPSLALPASGSFWNSLACGSITPTSASFFTWPSLCRCLYLVSVSKFFIKTPAIRASLSPALLHLNLTTWAETLVLNKVTFTGSGGMSTQYNPSAITNRTNLVLFLPFYRWRWSREPELHARGRKSRDRKAFSGRSMTGTAFRPRIWTPASQPSSLLSPEPPSALTGSRQEAA